MEFFDFDPFELNRRQFLTLTAGAGVAASLLHPAVAKAAEHGAPTKKDIPSATPLYKLQLKINGKSYRTEIDTRTTLLDLLRENLQLTGTKKGCDHGQCGACTVLVNGKRINSCLSLAVQNQNKEVITIEGLEKNGQLHPMQQAFVDHDALQCGYCTPGQIMSAVALLKEPCGHSEDEVRECMSGNICRCGTYRNILAAIQDVRGTKSKIIIEGDAQDAIV